MPSFCNSNTIRFRMPPLEDPPPDRNPHAAFRSLIRVVSEFGFLSSIINGMRLQRYGVLYQTSTAAEVTKFLVFLAGAVTFAANVSWLYGDSIFAPEYPDSTAELQQRRQQRRHRTRWLRPQRQRRE
ncbi:hypothetical protein ACP70R_020441 [Stipagrostis hirtigluma subsp. patula]